MSFKVIDVNNSKKLITTLVMISSMSVPICNRFHAKQAKSNKTFRGDSFFTLSFKENPFIQQSKISLQKN